MQLYTHMHVCHRNKHVHFMVASLPPSFHTQGLYSPHAEDWVKVQQALFELQENQE